VWVKELSRDYAAGGEILKVHQQDEQSAVGTADFVARDFNP